MQREKLPSVNPGMSLGQLISTLQAWGRAIGAPKAWDVRLTREDATAVPGTMLVCDMEEGAINVALPPAKLFPGQELIIASHGSGDTSATQYGYSARVNPSPDDVVWQNSSATIGYRYGFHIVHTMERFISDGRQWIPETETPGWRDQQGPAVQAAGASALTLEAYRDTPFLMEHMTHNQDDALSFTFQMNHDWDLGPVRPHIHFIPLAAGNGNVIFDGYYYIGNAIATVPALASWTAFSITAPIVSADQYTRDIVSIGEIQPPANARHSALLLLYLRRPGLSSASDTYTTGKPTGTAAANVALEFVDVHYRARQTGTVEEY